MAMFGEGDEMIVTVRKDKALEALKHNADQHGAKYEEALAGWYEAVKAAADRLGAAAEASDVPNTYLKARVALQGTRPGLHVQNYEQAIGMLELHTGSDIKIDSTQYNRFFRDEWSWSQQFRALHTSFAKV
jgi:hypothetical protein